jgi:predicted homoserine dehydrogenase-like protein
MDQWHFRATSGDWHRSRSRQVLVQVFAQNEPYFRKDNRELIMQKIRIGLIGAGETGTPLLKQLLDASFVEVVGVADLNEAMPGMALARARGIRTTTDFMEIALLGNKVDILIDVTGVPAVREKLREFFQQTGNHHTIIMHEMIAILMMSLSQNKLVSMKHGQTEYA